MILKQNNDSIYVAGDTLISIMIVDTIQAKTDTVLSQRGVADTIKGIQV